MKRVAASFFPPIALSAKTRFPIYRQLYDWFRGAILSGQLRPGQGVPSTRNLAAELNVSRIPVLTAFEQLHAEGYLETFVGAGTCVARSIPEEKSNFVAGKIRKPARQAGPRRISERGKALMRKPAQCWLENLGAFRVSLPALDHFPMSIWSRLVARHSRKPAEGAMAYGDPMGSMPFREAIADYLGTVRAVRCEPAQVMVVAGSQQGLQIAARVLVGANDSVWVEEPGYAGARSAFVSAGARLVPVSVDQGGLNVEEGIRRCRDARAVYITPSHQYPLGMTMSATRRMQLLNWAGRAGAWIIEDDYDSEYRFGSRPIASLHGMDTNARVIYVGTFSKILFPALRLAYVIVPKDLIPAFSAVREASDVFSPTLYQAALTDFMIEGHFARHIRRMRTLYMQRRDALVAEIRGQLGERLEVVNAEAGMHLVGLLRPRIEDTAVTSNAAQHGISVLPLSLCHMKKPSRGGLILGYGATDTEQIRAGVRALKVILESATRHPRKR
jgi:GntR family transcriptional regulator / MocR family aminotransferase